MFDSTEAAAAAAVNGLGIVSTGHLACLAELRGGTLVKVLPDWDVGSVDVHLVLPAGRTSKPSARAFVDFIGAVFSSQKNCTGND